MTVEHPYEFGEKVVADGERENPLTVIGLLYLPQQAVQVKCAYWINGDLKEVWIETWRLKRWEKP